MIYEVVIPHRARFGGLSGSNSHITFNTKELPDGTPFPREVFAHSFMPGVFAVVRFATASHVWFDRVNTRNREFRVVFCLDAHGKIYRRRLRDGSAYTNPEFWTVERFRRFFALAPDAPGTEFYRGNV